MENKYLYDTHIHTVETSPCGRIPAVKTVDYYAEHGYSGLIITDHLHSQFLDMHDSGDWQHVMDMYLRGYKAAKQRGDEIGFSVILGSEMRFTDNDCDYLVYNIDEEWLRTHPYVICQSEKDFFRQYHSEVLIMQAHPFRDGNTEIFEDAIHGIEVINTNERHENHTDRALELCSRHPEYHFQCGSDMHKRPDRCRAGVLLPERITDSFQYAEMIRSDACTLYAPEFPDYVKAFSDLLKNR